MRHTYVGRMSSSRTSNLLGALAVGLTDALTEVTERGARHGAAAPAALVTMADEARISIERLSQVLQLSHSGAVRLIDRLSADGLVERQSGRDQRRPSQRLSRSGVTAMTQPHRYPTPTSDRSPLSLIWPLFLSIRVRRLPAREEDMRKSRQSLTRESPR